MMKSIKTYHPNNLNFCLVSGNYLYNKYAKIGVRMKDKMHDVIINMDIMLGVISKSQEDAYNKVEDYTTEQLLTLALEQLPFHERDNSRYVEGNPTIN